MTDELHFVVPRHFGAGTPRGVHYDLLLQTRSVSPADTAAARLLLAFAVPFDRSPASWRTPPAVRVRLLPAHRLFYLDYEGPVSGGRGELARVDGGRLIWPAASGKPPAPESPPTRFVVELFGAAAQGRFRFEAVENKDEAERDWLMTPV